MDDRMLQFALFLGIAFAVLLLVVVGIDIARRIVRAWRAEPVRDSASTKPELH